jgi:hypothetical protein
MHRIPKAYAELTETLNGHDQHAWTFVIAALALEVTEKIFGDDWDAGNTDDGRLQVEFVLKHALLQAGRNPGDFAVLHRHDENADGSPWTEKRG